MTYEVDFAEAEKKDCSSRLTIENRIFYVKLFNQPLLKSKYFAGDQKGNIIKEISEIEFNFWLETLADKKADVDCIKAKLNLGKKFSV